MTIHGSKKGSSKPRQPIIAPDSAQSKTYINILYGLGEGEIAGLVNGYKSVYLDDTPLQNDNGEFNFPNVKVDFRSGTNDQTYIDGFPDVASETAVNVELKHGTPWIKSFNNLDLDALRIRLKWGALRSQNTDNGDVGGVKIDYAIDVKTDNGGWVQSLTTSINAKTSNNYERSHRIDLPPAQTGWQVRVRRITPNSTSDFVSDKMYVSAITEVIDLKLRYPNTALLGLRYDAESFSNVAKMSARCKGLIIKVPTNYDPETRTYTGMWDGTFKRAYTNNPAWVYYDLCTAERYGLGERLAPDMIDKWSLYRLAQYCDEMVDDGMGGQEPRFTINVYIQSAEGAFEVLSKLAGVFRAISYWDGNSIVVDADIPQDSMYSFSRANVIGGVFEYSGTRARDRHTVAKVAWNNPANHFKTEYEYVRDEKAIAKFGVRVADISAWGCTSKGQAQRAGLWALKSEQLETRMVTFKVGLDGYIPTPAKVIEISDELFAGRATGGRVFAINKAKTIITLDRPITANVGDTLVINGNDGISQRRQISAINGDKVTVTKPFGDIGVENVWVLDSADLATMKFRVMSVTADDNHQFTITAVQYNPAKYDAIDTGVYIDERPISVINPTVQAPTKSVNLSSYTQVNQGVSITTLVISWEQVTGAVKYAVEWRKDNGNWQALPATGTNSIEISGVYAGRYEAQVTAISAFGQASLATHSNLTEIQGKVGKPSRPAFIRATGVLFGMNLAWGFGAKSDDTNFTEIQVSPDGRSNIAILGTFAYPTNKHEITGLQGNLTQHYRARIVDKLGNTSDWTAWVSGTTDVQADKVLDLISGQISQSHLDQSLRTPINKIGTLESGLNSIKGQIPTLQSAISTINGQLSTLNNKITTAERNLQTAQSTLQTAVANITTERNRITSAIRDITALQSANNAKTQEIANLVQTVGSHTSSIRELGVTTGDLAQKYSQLKTVADKATSDITQIKQTQNGQATSIERLGAKFDNLSVGGRNLLIDSEYHTAVKWAQGNIRIATPIYKNRRLLQVFVTTSGIAQPGIVQHTDKALTGVTAGETYTLSLNAQGTAGFVATGLNYVYLMREDGNNYRLPVITITTSLSRRYKISFVAPWSSNRVRLLIGANGEFTTMDWFAFHSVKLERGNVATDWTPAPEDIQADIDTAKTETLANINTVRETLTNADIALGHRIDDVSAEFKQADNTIKASVQEEITARTNADAAIAQNVNALQSDYSSNKSSVASQIKTLSDKDKSTASQISQITANVAQAQQAANTANSKADDGIRRANNAQNKADTADAKATQAKADIVAERQARADSEGSLARQMSALDSKFTNADNAIKASVAQAQQTATNAQQALATAQSQLNAKIDGISVGGRNLILNTHNMTWWTWRPSDIIRGNRLELTQPLTNLGMRTPYQAGLSFEQGDIVTLSFDYRTDLDNLLYTFVLSRESGNGGGFSKPAIINDGQWHRVSMTTTMTRQRLNCAVLIGSYQSSDKSASYLEIKNVKLERGNIATDYTPAPEDVQSQLDKKASTASLDEFKSAQASQNEATAQRIAALNTAYRLADTTLTARLAHEEQARTSANAALAQNLDSLRSEFNGNKASLDAQLRTLSEKDKAQAQKLSQLEASLGQKASAANLNELNARVQNVDGKITAEIKKVATMQTTLHGQTASIRNVEQSVNGVKAIKAVTVDNNGFISGYGLMSELQNGRVISRFGINADQIYFGSTTSSKKPFVFATRPITIDGISYPVGAWLNSASIANASITNAHIANGSIDNAKIKNGAITTAKIGHAQIDTLQIKDGAVIVPRVQSFDATRLYQLNQEHEVFKLTLAETQVTTLITIHLYIDVWFDNEHVHGVSDFGFYRPHIQISLLKNTTPLATRTFETLVPKPFYSTSDTGRWHNQGVAYALQGDFYLTGVMDYVANEPAVYKVLISSTIKDGDPTNYSTAHLRLSQGSICIMSAKR